MNRRTLGKLAGSAATVAALVASSCDNGYGMGVGMDYGARWGGGASGPAVLVGAAPFALDPAFDEHSLQRRIERSFFHLEHLVRRDLNRLRDLETMQFPTAGQ